MQDIGRNVQALNYTECQINRSNKSSQHQTENTCNKSNKTVRYNQIGVQEEVEPEILFLDEQMEEDGCEIRADGFELLDDEAVKVKKNNLKTRLVQDMVTRWNSTLAMLTRLHEFSDYIR